ncbi:MAG: hypothetical protein BMS9Abin29_1244 [Gemmatimonadota bacterium]|nr:MAG: hypothetical protein BMS9Abin29_1244 [Gemmatimonadota bacterium]
MRRGFRIALGLTVVAGVLVGGSRVPDLLSELKYFRLTEFKLEGARVLTLEQVLQYMELPDGASVWDDPAGWSSRIGGHPMVRSVRLSMRFPRTLVISLEERVPVAFVATPVLEPVDRDGVVLPLDPVARHLDLPVLEGVAPNTAELRVLAAEAARFARTDPRFTAMLSDLKLDDQGNVLGSLGDEPVVFRFRPRLSARRLQEGIAVLTDARERRTDAVADVIDLRYEDQVVVHYSERSAVAQVEGTP